MEMREQIKQAVVDYIVLHGYPPTMQEIGQAVGRCKSIVNGYVTQMMVDGDLETDATQGSPRALRVPGMQLVCIEKDRAMTQQIESLREHCLEMSREPGASVDWKRDVEALEWAMSQLGGASD